MSSQSIFLPTHSTNSPFSNYAACEKPIFHWATDHPPKLISICVHTAWEWGYPPTRLPANLEPTFSNMQQRPVSDTTYDHQVYRQSQARP